MSILVALAGKEEIIVGADTICIAEEDGNTYVCSTDHDRHAKIYPMSNTQFGVGLGGAIFGERAINAKLPKRDNFDMAVREFFEFIEKEYKESHCHLAFDYLFVGYKGDDPQIVRASFFQDYRCDRKPANSGLIESKFGRCAVGCAEHGALYWIYSFHDKSLPTETNRLLAYFALKETILHDKRTREPIQMMSVRPGVDAEFLSETEMKRIDATYQKRRAEIFNLLRT